MMTIEEFLFDLPLYQRVQKEDCEDIVRFLTSQWSGETVDGYNPIRQCDSTFTLFCGMNQSVVSDDFSSYKVVSASGKIKKFSTFEVILKCKRYGTLLHYLVHVEKGDEGDEQDKWYLSKVGQYPSVADFHIGQVHKYDKVLQKDKMREFTKAIGLAANGIGVGAFVYLRRIFEYLVSEAFDMIKKDKLEFDEKAFFSAKMSERIQMLSGYLPGYLVENHTIYSILSKGIHELNEEECRRYFSVLKASIEMILEEKLEAYQKTKRKKEISDTLSQIAGKKKEHDGSSR